MDAVNHFNNVSHLLRDDFSQAADALIQHYLDEIAKLKAAKVEVRKATDPVCGLPKMMDLLDDKSAEAIARKFCPEQSANDTHPLMMSGAPGG